MMRQEPDGRWTARSDGTDGVRATGATRERCLANLRRSLARADGRRPAADARDADAHDAGGTLVVEVQPQLAGVAEAAAIMGWDKRRVVTYIDRGSFPEPVQQLASGRLWLRSDVEAFAADWQARQARRAARAERRGRRRPAAPAVG